MNFKWWPIKTGSGLIFEFCQILMDIWGNIYLGWNNADKLNTKAGNNKELQDYDQVR